MVGLCSLLMPSEYWAAGHRQGPPRLMEHNETTERTPTDTQVQSLIRTLATADPDFRTYAEVNDSHSLGKAAHLFVRALQGAEPATQADLRQRWQEAGLDRLATLGALVRQLKEQQTDD